MKIFAQNQGLNFPYLWDSTQDVMRSFGVEYTPTAFLIDQSGVVRYKGQIDDHPQDQSIRGKDYLRNAIASLLAGKQIQIRQTEQIGTAAVWRS
jgi:peroxiredoxin